MTIIQFNLAAVFLTMAKQPNMPKQYSTNHFIASDNHGNINTLISLVKDQYAVCTEPLETLSMSRLYELTPLGLMHFERIWKSIYRSADRRQCPQCNNRKAVLAELCGHCQLDLLESKLPKSSRQVLSKANAS